MRTVTISVTQEDIDDGIPEDDCSCPIALAIRRVLPPDLEVTCVMIPFYGPALATIGEQDCPLPDECKEFIEFFDNMPPAMLNQPRPFSFEMEVPECV